MREEVPECITAFEVLRDNMCIIKTFLNTEAVLVDAGIIMYDIISLSSHCRRISSSFVKRT